VDPEARRRVGGCGLLLLGTVAGFVPEADRVRAAFATHRPELLALGVPPEDLPTLRLLAEHPERAQDLPALDEAEARRQELLRRFGATRVPSPDLEAAFAQAQEAGVPVEALDLDDVAHSAAYTHGMKVRHLVRASSRRKKALKADFAGARSAHELAVAWDEALAVDPMRELERLRERHMAQRLGELAAGRQSLLAIVPVQRLAGVLASLDAGPAAT